MQVHYFVRLSVALAALALFSTVPGLAQEKKTEPQTVVDPAKEVDKPTPVKESDKPDPAKEADKGDPTKPGKVREAVIVPCPDRKEVEGKLKKYASSVPQVRPAEGSLPPDCSEVSRPTAQPVSMGFGATRGWDAEEYTWTAPGLQHKPIYFEDIPLERYGQSKGYFVQPLVSSARFFAVIPTLPYQMALDPPLRPICTLGYERPGNCVPYVRHRLPWNTRAAVAQVGTVAGLILLIP